MKALQNLACESCLVLCQSVSVLESTSLQSSNVPYIIVFLWDSRSYFLTEVLFDVFQNVNVVNLYVLASFSVGTGTLDFLFWSPLVVSKYPNTGEWDSI